VRRVKWIAAKWPVSFRDLGRRLAESKFSADSTRGFILTRTRNDIIEGKYFERFLTTDVVTDPFGEQKSYERIEFKSTHFLFSPNFPQVELSNSPRSINSFTSHLLQIMDFKLEWITLNVNVLTWAEQLEKLIGGNVTISQIQVTGLKVDEFTTLAASLTSTRDIRGALTDFTKKRSHQLDRLVASVPIEGRTLRVELRSDATIRLPEEGSSILPMVRHSVPQESE
jgi:hypothetical protein